MAGFALSLTMLYASTYYKLRGKTERLRTNSVVTCDQWWWQEQRTYDWLHNGVAVTDADSIRGPLIYILSVVVFFVF